MMVHKMILFTALSVTASLVWMGVMSESAMAQSQDESLAERDFTDPTELPEKTNEKYFVIQNVATETARVYEKCNDLTKCQHRLIFEAEMVVGRRKNSFVDAKEWYTHLGVNRIKYWDKYHEDGNGHYPAWYAKNYPAVPPPGSSFYDWFERDVMPDDRGVMRGAFGWFTAILGPNAQAQWMHGTAGWGSDGDKYIKITRNTLISSVRDARSSGCTRLENGAIAYLRHLLPVGTPVIRVYAKEAVEEPSLAHYSSQKLRTPFYYILTKSDRVNDSKADTIERKTVLARGVPASEWIEEGLYNVDQYPTVRKYHASPGWIGAGSGALGNVYRIYFNEFEGHYLVDTGRFVKYQHPTSLPVSGIPDVVVPDYTVAPDSTEPHAPDSYEE